jgi:ketosteroid isomerase-like protein
MLQLIKSIILIVDDRVTRKKAASHRDKGRAMPQSATDAVAAVEQRRIDALIASDINALEEIIDEHCTHIESNGTSRTKAAFLEDVAQREFSFDLFEIDENQIRIFGDTAVVAGTYHNVVRVRGTPHPVKHARHLRVDVNRGGSWKLVAHQATEIASQAS